MKLREKLAIAFFKEKSAAEDGNEVIPQWSSAALCKRNS